MTVNEWGFVSCGNGNGHVFFATSVTARLGPPELTTTPVHSKHTTHPMPHYRNSFQPPLR